MQQCSEFTIATAGTIGMAEDNVEEGIVDVEIVEEVDYGGAGFLDGSSST